MRTLALLSALLVSISAHAAPPSDASIDTLLAAMKAEAVTDSVFASLDQVMRQSLASATQGQSLSAEQRRVLDATPAKFAQVVRDELSWVKMRPLYVQVYRESFNQEEIDGLVAFYKSPAGVAYVDKMPVVMQKSMALMQSRMAPMMEKMKKAVQEAVEEAKAVK